VGEACVALTMENVVGTIRARHALSPQWKMLLAQNKKTT
jgi:hypothetical protein